MIRPRPRVVLAGAMAFLAEAASAASQPSRSGATIVLGAPKFSIGSEDVEGPSLFGHVQSVAIDGDGRIYVLDVSDNSIRIFDSRGRFVDKVGRAGRGPGDFANPWGLVHDGRRGLFVADQVSGIAHFETSAIGAKFSRVLGRSLLPRTACLVGDTMVVGGVSDEKLLHVLDREGDPLRSFGESFRSDTVAALREMANREPVMAACDSPRRRIVVAQHRGPLVRAYDMDGRQLWPVQLSDYEGAELQPTSRAHRVALPDILWNGDAYRRCGFRIEESIDRVRAAEK